MLEMTAMGECVLIWGGGSHFRERGVHRGFTKRGVHKGVHKKGGSRVWREPWEPPLATGLLGSKIFLRKGVICRSINFSSTLDMDDKMLTGL